LSKIQTLIRLRLFRKTSEKVVQKFFTGKYPCYNREKNKATRITGGMKNE